MIDQRQLRAEYSSLVRLARDAIARRMPELANAYADAALRVAAERLELVNGLAE